MKAKDIKPGVVYGYRSSTLDHVRPVVFLAPPDDTHRYQTASRPRGSGTPAYVKAQPGAKLGEGKLMSTPTVGFPAVKISWMRGEGAKPADLLQVTLDDFEAATSHIAPVPGVEFTLVTRLASIHGLYDVLVAQEQAEEDAEKRRLAEQRDAAARTRAAADALVARGFPSATARQDRFGGALLTLDPDDAEKLLTMLTPMED